MKLDKTLQIITGCWLVLTAIAITFGRIAGDITSGEFFIALMVWVSMNFHMMDRLNTNGRENSL